MPGYNSQRRGTAGTILKLIVLFHVLFVSIVFSMHYVCINVYSTTATHSQVWGSQILNEYHGSSFMERISEFFNFSEGNTKFMVS